MHSLLFTMNTNEHVEGRIPIQILAQITAKITMDIHGPLVMTTFLSFGMRQIAPFPNRPVILALSRVHFG